MHNHFAIQRVDMSDIARMLLLALFCGLSGQASSLSNVYSLSREGEDLECLDTSCM